MIVDLKEYPAWLEEYCTLCAKEWSTEKDPLKLEQKIQNKVRRIQTNENDQLIIALGYIEDHTLIGFISLFHYDGDERRDLTPWYATMYVKEEYRGCGYSKKLHQAILEEAKRRGYHSIYLKSDLENYYEKFGATFMEVLKNGERLYQIKL